MKIPDFDTDAYSDDKNLEAKSDDAVQDVYDAAIEAIEKHLGVTVERPTKHNVHFICGNAHVDLQYAETGEERYWIEEDDLSHDEFVERTSKLTRQKLKKAITIYAKVVEAQQSIVGCGILEARYT